METSTALLGASPPITGDSGMQARLGQILEATTDYVAVSTPEGVVTYLNGAARDAAGISRNAPLGSMLLADLHPDWAYEIVRQEGIPQALAEGVWRGETAFRRHDASEITVSHLILSHVEPDGARFISTIMRDLSERKREELARIELANRYDAAIRASGQVLFDWDSLTHDIAYSGDTEQIFGFSIEELRGGWGRFRQLVDPADLQAFDEEIQRVAITRDPFFAEFRIRRGDQRIAFVQVKGYFFLDRAGRLSRMIGFFVDITQQRLAQQELAGAHDRLEARVEERTAELEQASAVIEARAEQQEAVAQLGQRALRGAELSELFSETASLVQTILKVDFCSVIELDPATMEFVVRAHAGWPERIRDVRLGPGTSSQSGYTVLSGEPVVVGRMIDERRFRVSEQLIRCGVTSSASVLIGGGEIPMGVLAVFHREERKFSQDNLYYLQSMANVLTAAISRQRADETVRMASAQAEKANRAKSAFLSRMSHELRTPLNAILGFAQLLELEEATPSQQESIDHICRAGSHLLSLINEVLDIARVEAGRMPLHQEAVELAALVPETVELVGPLAQRNDIKIRVEGLEEVSPTHILADRQRLKQVLLNLLSNAVKYNRPGGQICVSVRAEKGGKVRLGVSDTGIGIAKKNLFRLFTPFDRLGVEATGIEGTGIGLALSRGIVDALGGEIGVESVENVGSTFWVVLPGASAPGKIIPPAVSPALSEPQAGSRPSTLLYIEDQVMNLRLVERILARYPQYRLVSAMQGGLGLELAREHHPDLVLLDLNLPDLSGEEVLHRLKSDASTRDIPVVMVSADAMGDRGERLMAAGAHSYLTKPFKLAELLQVVREALGENLITAAPAL